MNPDNHKPSLSSGTRTSNIKLSNNNTYKLSLHDKNDAGDNDMFVFSGTRTAPSKSYVLLFDQTTHKATLERLDSTYTFNLSTKNGTDVSSSYGKIYPKKSHKDSVHDKEEGEIELFGDEPGDEANEGTEPDASNPYDFRHFLNAVKSKKDTPEDRGYASSPDYRSNAAASTVDTPVLPARRAVEPAAKKRKAASLFAKKPTAKGAATSKKPTAPAINLERRATERSQPSTSQSKPAAAGAPASKIKSAEFIQSSDESDVDADGEPDSSFPTPRHTTTTRRSPSPGHRTHDTHSSAEEDSADDGELEIEVPDTRPSHRHTAHLNVSSGAAARGLRSPSNGPISLASAATSVAGTPRQHTAAEEIDFGDLDVDGDADADGDEEDEDVDVERMDIGPPARPERGDRKSVSAAQGSGGGAGGGNGAAAAEVDEDELYMEMMEGLAGGDSSEESEEE